MEDGTMAMFNKRHYEAIATVMQESYSDDSGDGGGADVWSGIVVSLADMFARDNGLFNRERFERACQPGADIDGTQKT
jgi:hypothetical protein